MAGNRLKELNGRKTHPDPDDAHAFATAEFTDLHGREIDKAEHFGWTTVDSPGKFRSVPKEELNIDHTYQRERVSNKRVARFASRWSWMRCNALMVAERADGTLWVFDGQHRLLAAKKRSDIRRLPCMIFNADDVGGEAAAFVGANTDRGGLAAWNKHNALLRSRDPVAQDIDSVVRAAGYAMVEPSGHGANTMRCVAAAYRCYKADKDAFKAAVPVLAALAGGEPITDRLLMGAVTMEKHMRKRGVGTIADEPHRGRLLAGTFKQAMNAIIDEVAGARSSGERVYANGLIGLVNGKVRSSSRTYIPYIPAKSRED